MYQYSLALDRSNLAKCLHLVIVDKVQVHCYTVADVNMYFGTESVKTFSSKY